MIGAALIMASFIAGIVTLVITGHPVFAALLIVCLCGVSIKGGKQ